MVVRPDRAGGAISAGLWRIANQGECETAAARLGDVSRGHHRIVSILSLSVSTRPASQRHIHRFAIDSRRLVQKIKNMRLPIGISFLLAAAAYIPWIYGDGRIGSDYWKYYVPAFIVGSGAMAISYLGVK